MLLGLLALVRAAIELAEAEVVVSDEGAHVVAVAFVGADEDGGTRSREVSDVVGEPTVGCDLLAWVSEPGTNAMMNVFERDHQGRGAVQGVDVRRGQIVRTFRGRPGLWWRRLA